MKLVRAVPGLVVAGRLRIRGAVPVSGIDPRAALSAILGICPEDRCALSRARQAVAC